MRRTYVLDGDEWVEKTPRRRVDAHYVQGDIAPYKSMINGQMIASRSQHRAHLKAHGCVEVGNEDPTKHIAKPKQDNTRLERLRHEVNNRLTNDQADRLLRQLRTELNFTNPHRKG